MLTISSGLKVYPPPALSIPNTTAILQKESYRQRQNGCAAPNQILVLLNCCLLEPPSGGVVDQVLHAVEEMVDKGPGQGQLDAALDGQRQAGEGRSDG